MLAKKTNLNTFIHSNNKLKKEQKQKKSTLIPSPKLNHKDNRLDLILLIQAK